MPPTHKKTGRDFYKTIRQSFYFLAEQIAEINTSYIFNISNEESLISYQDVNFENVAPCTQEEADARIFFHARHADVQGSKALVIKANDADVQVIANAAAPSLYQFGLNKIHMMFGQGWSLGWTAIHDITSAIGPDKTNGTMPSLVVI